MGMESEFYCCLRGGMGGFCVWDMVVMRGVEWSGKGDCPSLVDLNDL